MKFILIVMFLAAVIPIVRAMRRRRRRSEDAKVIGTQIMNWLEEMVDEAQGAGRGAFDGPGEELVVDGRTQKFVRVTCHHGVAVSLSRDSGDARIWVLAKWPDGKTEFRAIFRAKSALGHRAGKLFDLLERPAVEHVEEPS